MIEGAFQFLFLIFFIWLWMMDMGARKKRQNIEHKDKIARKEGVADLGESSSIKTEETSDGMVPGELWKEIADLTRVDSLPSTGNLPPVEFPGDTNPSEARDDASVDGFPSSSQDHPSYTYTYPDDHSLARTEVTSVTKSSPAMSGREKSAIVTDQLIGTGEQNLGEYRKLDLPKITKKRSVINTLKRGGSRSIQQAVILSEVLGMPAALKNSNHESPS